MYSRVDSQGVEDVGLVHGVRALWWGLQIGNCRVVVSPSRRNESTQVHRNQPRPHPTAVIHIMKARTTMRQTRERGPATPEGTLERKGPSTFESGAWIMAVAGLVWFGWV